jgi:DNA helicase-2/ATP-dependent DNA helicase PcrA
MTDQTQHWSDGLEGPAYNIAAANPPRLRVLAGPGTGKTFAMKRRVMRLLQEGKDSHRILVLTFTRTAARDLATEIASLGAPGVEEVHAGTLHGYCFSVLSRAEILLATGRCPRPLIGFEERFLLGDLAKAFGGIRKSELRLAAFNAAWARLQSDEPGWPLDQTDKAFQKVLLGWLGFHQAMLVGELVPVTLQYLRANPKCPERQAFGDVIVDEYQDLNRAEQVLIDLLAEKGQLTIVGDEDQSIYSFKHAHPEGITTFHSDHAGCQDEQLTECRRCPKTVVEMATALIGQNPTASGRPLHPSSANPPGEVSIVQWTTAGEEAEGVAEFVKRKIQEGAVEAGRVLVLATRRQFGYSVRDALNKRAIPAHSFFTEEALEGNPTDLGKSDAQQAFSLLVQLSDPEDRVSLRCWCGFGSASLAAPAWRRITERCNQAGRSPREQLLAMSSGAESLPHCQSVVDRFNELETRLVALGPLTGQPLVDALFPVGHEWAEPLRRIATAAIDQTEAFDAAFLLDTIRSGVTQPELPTDVDYVRVMSLHKSKGLTADLVVITGCVQGAIPRRPDSSLSYLENQRILEEQRRLFYVALTRTTSTLVISSVSYLPRDVAWKMNIPVAGQLSLGKTISSAFLSDLGPTAPKPVDGDTLIP